MKNKKFSIAGIVLGSILALGPMWGLLFSVLGIGHAFTVLAASGVSDPRALAHSIGFALMGTATGIFVFPIGVILLVVSLVSFCSQCKTTANSPASSLSQ